MCTANGADFGNVADAMRAGVAVADYLNSYDAADLEPAVLGGALVSFGEIQTKLAVASPICGTEEILTEAGASLEDLATITVAALAQWQWQWSTRSGPRGHAQRAAEILRRPPTRLRAADAGVTDCRSAGRSATSPGRASLDTWGDSSAGRNQIGDVGVELGERLVESGKAGGV
jgi:hypothetical protein